MNDTMNTYLAKDDKYYKIGKSNNPIRRIDGMKTSNPSIRLIGLINKDIEKELHFKYKHKKVIREWYDLSNEDVSEIFKDLKIHEEKYSIPKNRNTLKDIKFRKYLII